MRRRAFLVLFCSAISVLLAAITVSAQRPAVDQVWMGPPDLAGSFQPVRELSGRLEVTSFIGPTNPADLQAVCDERRDAEKSAVDFNLQNYNVIARLQGPGRDEKTFVWTSYILAQVRAYFGQLGETTSLLQKARDDVEASAAHNAFPAGPSMFDGLIGISELRRGEIENCQMHPNAQRCIFPITGMGHHDMPSGAEHAMASFERALAASPDDLELRWLLNVAAMTVGKYPAGVPARYLIPPDRFQSAEDIGQFTDEAPSLGLDHVSRAGGVVMDDFNGDGRNDIAISSVDPCEPLRLYLQQPDGHFAEAANAGLDAELGGINLVQADYNNDGRLDLYVMRGGWENAIRNSLLRNNGDGTFTDVTKEAGLLDVPHSTHSAAWADFDNDGFLDLFVGHERTPSRLYRNRGNGTFEDVTKRAGVDVRGFVKGVAWGDYDRDGYQDLYVSNFGQSNVLFHNNGDGTFTDVTARMGVASPRMSFSTWFFDYDNDGWPDLFVAGFVPSIVEAVKPYVGQHSTAETMKLYRNLKGHGFEDVTAKVGLDRVTLTMGANFGDVDNDGWLDIYLGNGAPSYAALAPNLLFRNHDGARFVDISTSSGTGHMQKGHGIAIGDLEGDGNEDIFANMGGFVPADSFAKVLFRNPGHHGHWIGLTLTGIRTNRSAIGARVTVYARNTGDTTDRMIPRVVSSGGSFGASPLSVHVGLGTAERVSRVEIYWPVSQSLQVVESPPIDAVTHVTEPIGPEPTH